ncbi:hypothetical protein D3C87_1703870 [compost metagenome]
MPFDHGQLQRQRIGLAAHEADHRPALVAGGLDLGEVMIAGAFSAIDGKAVGVFSLDHVAERRECLACQRLYLDLLHVTLLRLMLIVYGVPAPAMRPKTRSRLTPPSG